MSFILATWNILATAYIRREWYPRTGRRFLEPSWRVPALAASARDLGADVLCLQEVEVSAYEAIGSVMAEAGYSGTHALKGKGRPDGCATFFRNDRFKLAGARRMEYTDDSGHILQLVILEEEGRRLAIGNTHLKWDPPPPETGRRWGYNQVRQAIDGLTAETDSAGQILCGDLNVTPDSEVVEALTGAGFDYAHRNCPDARTCNSNAHARLIDYIFHRGPLDATALSPSPLEDLTPLPSSEQPSDHLPLAVRFDWQ